MPASADPSTLPALFRATALRTPEAVAVQDGAEAIGYARLDALSDRLAVRLLDSGVGSGDLVGVLVDRTAASVAALLAVMKAGAAYVPLDPAYPVERLRYMVQDAGIRFVTGPAVGQVDLGAGASVTEVALADLTSPGAGSDPGAGGDRKPLPAGSPDDPAYVIYTSGSTGRPKGCVVTHRNVLALLDAAVPLLGFGPGERWTLFHSLSFDFSVWEMWGAFATGGTVVTVPPEAARSPERLIDLLTAQRITVLNQVPSVFRYTTTAYREAGCPPLTLRHLVFGGESVDLGVVRDFLAALPGSGAASVPSVVNMYGITETTVHVTYKRLDAAALAAGVTSPIGRPLPHLSVQVLDDDRRPVPPGEVGEMWVAGDGVAAGYLNRPELTRERFVELDTGEGPRRHYRTGDLARTLPDGELEYAGRADQQLKLRGFRIEPGEIETVLRASGLLRDVAVTVATTRAGSTLLLACVVPEPDRGEGLQAALRAHAAARLPAHMVPDRYRVMEALPLTPSGKTDRRALAGPPTGPQARVRATEGNAS